MTSRPSTAAPIPAVLAISLLVYTVGYFRHGEYVEISAGGSAVPMRVDVIDRAYPQQWMATAFRPAAKLEGWLRGVLVVTRQIESK